MSKRRKPGRPTPSQKGGEWSGQYDLRHTDGRDNPVTVSYRCVCPRACRVHPRGGKGGESAT